MHIATAVELDKRLLPALLNLCSNLERKAAEFEDLIKIGSNKKSISSEKLM